MTYGEPTKSAKLVHIVCGVVLLAFFACLPAMYADQQKREQQLWQELGCQKYDSYKISDVPAACQNSFVDHYSPQDQRLQPPTKSKLQGGEE